MRLRQKARVERGDGYAEADRNEGIDYRAVVGYGTLFPTIAILLGL